MELSEWIAVELFVADKDEEVEAPAHEGCPVGSACELVGQPVVAPEQSQDLEGGDSVKREQKEKREGQDKMSQLVRRTGVGPCGEIEQSTAEKVEYGDSQQRF